MSNVYIIGSGMLRFGKYENETVRSMAIDAINLALQDAKLDQKDLESAFFSNSFWGMFGNQHSIRGQVILRGMGIEKIPVTNVENACAGASTALHLAYTAIKAGMQDISLVFGSEKITSKDKNASFAAYGTAMDVENFQAHIQKIVQHSTSFKNLKIPEDESKPGQGRSIFMDAYALGARWHMDRFGTTQEQLAAISAKNHYHGSLNPLAQYQKDMTTEQVLADAKVAYPLTRSMCAPVGDGAAACIVASEEYVKKHDITNAIKISASVHGQGSDRDIDGEDIGERLSKQAYEMAGIGPDNISFAELHDATAYGELHQSEVMGFCPIGKGGEFALSGATRLGGSKPLNTSGGLECRGHPIGASGLAQIHELVIQLRGEAGERQVENAQIGLAENGGGSIGLEEAAMCIHILEAPHLLKSLSHKE